MQEIWVIRGRTPVLWRFPYFVTWQENDRAHLTEGVALGPLWRQAATALLELHGEYRGGDWVLSRAALHGVGEKTRGGDPAMYFYWGPPRPVDRRPNPDRAARSLWLEEFYLKGGGQGLTPEQLTSLWREFSVYIADTLINKEQPVDFHFFKLHNSPYRANWKTILTQRFRRLGPTLQHRSGTAREYALDQSGFREELLSLDLLAFCRSSATCYRQIEVEHRPKWWKLVHRAERERSRHGPEAYAEYFLDSLRRFIQPAIALYSAWLAQIARPCVADCESGYDGRIRFVPHHLAGKLHPSSREYCGLAPVVPNKLPRYKAASNPFDLFGANGGVPEMPPVQPPPQDLRDGGDPGGGIAVDQSRDAPG